MTTRVTATDTETGESETVEIENDYCLITDGTCRLATTQKYPVYATHQLNVVGVQRRA